MHGDTPNARGRGSKAIRECTVTLHVHLKYIKSCGALGGSVECTVTLHVHLKNIKSCGALRGSVECTVTLHVHLKNIKSCGALRGSVECFVFEEARRQAAEAGECLRRAHAGSSDLAAVEEGIRKQV